MAWSLYFWYFRLIDLVKDIFLVKIPFYPFGHLNIGAKARRRDEEESKLQKSTNPTWQPFQNWCSLFLRSYPIMHCARTGSLKLLMLVLTFYHECCSLIGYATPCVLCCRTWVAVVKKKSAAFSRLSMFFSVCDLDYLVVMFWRSEDLSIKKWNFATCFVILRCWRIVRALKWLDMFDVPLCVDRLTMSVLVPTRIIK